MDLAKYSSAEDISLVCNDIAKLSAAVLILMDHTFTEWGLSIGTQKTKVLVVHHVGDAQAADATIHI